VNHDFSSSTRPPRALVAYACKRFPLVHVDGPLTDNGAALFKTVWPQTLEPAAVEGQ